jgi:DNA polymerase-3 subunit gamma/tau
VSEQSKPETPHPTPTRTENTRPKTTLNLGNILKPTQKQVEIKSEEKNGSLITHDQSVTEKQVKEAWTQYAEERKSNVAEYHLLNRGFEFHNNQITIHLTNPIEEPLLLSIKTGLVEFLRAKLNNNSIQVTSVLQEFQSNRIAYTNKDKFDYLAEKNPILLQLKERFGLDPDF